MSKLAFIGLGAMGEPMAANLLKKGFAVTVVRHRRPDPAARLKALGAAVVVTPAEAAAGCDIVFLSLPTSREVEEVVLGENGLAASAAAGTVIADCSTSNPGSTRRLSALLKPRNIGLVDAPVTRGVEGARRGTLAFFLGGEQTDIDRIKPPLQAMGDTFIYFGTAGSAHTAKVISNVLSYGTVALVNEALMLGATNGLDLDVLHQALMLGAPSKALETFGRRIIAREHHPARVTVGHVCEDMLLAQELAASTSAPIFLMAAAQEIYRLLNVQGRGGHDMACIGELWRSSAGAPAEG